MKSPFPILLLTPTPAPGDPTGQGHVYPTQGGLSTPSCPPTLMTRNPSWSSLPRPSLCLRTLYLGSQVGVAPPIQGDPVLLGRKKVGR